MAALFGDDDDDDLGIALPGRKGKLGTGRGRGGRGGRKRAVGVGGSFVGGLLAQTLATRSCRCRPMTQKHKLGTGITPAAPHTRTRT